MKQNEFILKQIYDSDVILPDNESALLEIINDSIFDLLEDFFNRINQGQLTISEEEFHELEKRFNAFYYEYAYYQFKRGLELGLCFLSVLE
ncbi:MAG: hypothetical protein LUF02_02720 [Erysipelotrichaceae bacterium]|nr:hypothetical protein [Erysipelotrichaceae bacterium]